MSTKFRHIVMLSGGKDSTALAIHLREKYPDRDFEFVFCDTHKELPETYEYLNRIEAFLGKPVKRLSSKIGERGFDHYLKLYGNFLPSPKQRWCTRNLKIEPFERYVADDPTILYVGLRADERRTGYISTKSNIEARFPFKEAGINKSEVFRILQRSGVGIPKYYEWRSRSGCYFCFFQQKAEWVRLKEHHPELYERAKGYEDAKGGYTWVQGESLAELEQPERQEQIIYREKHRLESLSKRQKPKNLAQAFGLEDIAEDDEIGCLICHL